MSLLHMIRGLRQNPFFMDDWQRRDRQAAAGVLIGANALYVALFTATRIASDGSPEAGHAQTIQAAFDYAPWMGAGAGLLSLSAHWLVPPFLLAILRRKHDLRVLRMMVRGQHSQEEVFRGQVAAGLAPLLLGALPLAVGLFLLLWFGSDHAFAAGVAFPAAGLWGALGAGSTLWVGLNCRPRWAPLYAYALISLALPLTVGGITLAIAMGCSLGRPDQEAAFRAAAILTWGILVTGLTALFWDLTVGRLFPERRRALWQEAEAVRLEP